MTVSSGTYVRSIVHDLGLALGSAAHVVKLTRTRQGEFVLDPPEASTVLSAGGEEPAASAAGEGAVDGAEGEAAKADGEAAAAGDGASEPAPAPAAPVELDTFTGGCVEWTLLEAALQAQDEAKKSGKEVEGRDEDGWLEWERDLLSKCKEL